MPTTIRKRITIPTARENPIQIGDSTQIHGQLITPVNFSPTNKIVNKPVNPIPLDADDDADEL